jgi:hypothetical protein
MGLINPDGTSDSPLNFDKTSLTYLGIPDTPVDEPPRDPNAPTRDNSNGGDQSPKSDRNQSDDNKGPNQVPKSPKRDR